MEQSQGLIIGDKLSGIKQFLEKSDMHCQKRKDLMTALCSQPQIKTERLSDDGKDGMIVRVSEEPGQKR